MIEMPTPSWSFFKQTCITQKGLALQYVPSPEGGYDIYGIDNGMAWFISIRPGVNDSDIADFETNFKPTANARVSQLDSDGAVMSRIKVAPSGWNFQFRGIEFATSTVGSLINKDATGADLTDATLFLYNAQNEVITDQPTADLYCVKTVVDVEPPYDIYLAGGKLKMLATPTTDVRFSVIGVPDVPAQLGGSKAFIQNINLKYLPAADGVNADGRAAKWLQYNSTYHTNKIRLIFHHDAGVKVSMAMFIEVYKL